MAKLTTRLIVEALENKRINAVLHRGDNGDPYLHCKYAGDDVTINLMDGGVLVNGFDALHQSELTKLQTLYLQ